MKQNDYLALTQRRKDYLALIQKRKSPLEDIRNFSQIVNARTDDLSESSEIYLQAAKEIESIGTAESISRAIFIRQQVQGVFDKDFFDSNKESWGIPNFAEELVTIDDFRFGFLWKFRDHTTSWSEDYEARDWFFKFIEAQTARVWQIWTTDDGYKEMIYEEKGSYKTILETLVNKYKDYHALSSPVFTRRELDEFLSNYDESKGDYEKEVIIEDYFQRNPNWHQNNLFY